MRNLQLFKCTKRKLECQSIQSLIHWNSSLLAIDEHSNLHMISDDLLSSVIPSHITATVVGAHFHPVDQTVLIALFTGELIVRMIDGSQVSEEEVGCFPTGVRAFSVSPDNELVAVVTGDGQLVYILRSSLIILSEVSLEAASNSHVKEHVSVGWGKKETQFHGSAGKRAALEKIIVEEKALHFDVGVPVVSWRNDSQYCACSFVFHTDSSRREIVVFDRDCNAISVKEVTEGLGPCMAWRNDGTLITASQVLPSGEKNIIFYEKNGLRHGEFSLPNSEEEVVGLSWNCDGTILAVVMKGRVDFWTCMNYHWYLKYQFPVSGNFSNLLWDLSLPEVVNISCSEDSNIYSIEFINVVDRSSCSINDPLSLVAVVDASQISLTPFAIANVPPPMSFSKIKLDRVPTCIGLYSGKDRCLLAVGDPNLTVNIFELKFTQNSMEYVQIHSLTLSSRARKIVLPSCDKVYLLNEEDNLFYFTLSSSSGECIGEKISSFSVEENGLVITQGRDGAYRNVLTGSFLAKDTITPWMGVFDPEHFVGRTGQRCFSVDGLEVTRECTSFIIHPEFVCTSDPNGVIRFYPLNTDPSIWSTMKIDGEESSRLTEGGAICIAVVSSKAALIVQLPRGNLEIVYPRAFVLSQVRRLLNSLNYRDAFLLCRRHRVDLNIIHDNNSELFTSTIGKFVQDIPEVDYLNLFISNLRNENVVATRYGSFLKGDNMVKIFPSKVNDVCDKFEMSLRDIGESSSYAETLMTINVCRDPPNYEAALKIIVDLSEACGGASLVEKGLKYLIFLVPAEKLYKVALGMYDLPLSLSVARRSQMDPMEYTEFLNGLNEIEKLSFRKFKIDDFLQRYELALGHLIDSGAVWEKCQEYIQRHGLFREAFKAFHDRHLINEWKQTNLIYAEKCKSSSSYDAAADLYFYGESYDDAIDMAILAGSWQKVLSWSSVSLEKYKLLAERLFEQKRFNEAIMIAERFIGVDDAIQLGIRANSWMECYRISFRSSNEKVLNAALQQLSNVQSELDELKNSFIEKSTRLELVQRQLVESMDPDKISAALESSIGVDSISDSLSIMSFRTTTTFAGSQISRATTSKSKKKSERQRMRGKQGSPYEREYLRETLKDTIQRLYSLQKNSQDLIQYLALERHFENVRILVNSFKAFAIFIRESFDRIKRLIQEQDTKLTPDLLACLGLTPSSIPPTLAVDHAWKTGFDLPSDFGALPLIEYC